MKFGFQISIRGGFDKVAKRAQNLGCEAIQLFSRNPRGWNAKALTTYEIEGFKKSIGEGFPIFVHTPYLLNLASPDKELWAKSICSLCKDLERANLLGAIGVITHPGYWIKGNMEEAIERIGKGINLAFKRVKNYVKLLIENTAGEGTAIGYKFIQIKNILHKIEDKERIGICLDTAHLYQAGYDIKTKEGLKDMVTEFNKLIGIKKIMVLHLNDSKTPLGSRKDRHWHIGKGYIGLNGFKNIINLDIFSKLPGIMETPRKSDKDDIKNMEVIRKLENPIQKQQLQLQ